MSDRKWFLFSDDQIIGPYKQDEVAHHAEGLKNPLVWGRGSTDWVPLSRLSKLSSDLESMDKKPKLGSDRLWKIRNGAVESKPMFHDQMMDYLRPLKDFSAVQIWTEGYSEWKDIYQIHKLMDELGVSRRQHPRVPIMGTLNCEGTTGSFNARVLSISEGGLGITEAPDVKIGEKFKTVLKSSNLYGPIHSTVEVVYVGSDQYAGLKFVGLQSESKSAIIEYVRKFIELKPNN